MTTKKEQTYNSHANLALGLSILGIFMAAIICEPVALGLGIATVAKTKDGGTAAKATVAIVISGICVGLFLIAFMIGFTNGLAS